MVSTGKNASNPLRGVDEAPLSMKHAKVWFTSGMGFFTDAYDLFIIGIALTVIEKYKLAGYPAEASIVSVAATASLAAAIIGQLVFGFLADRLGRKSVYGIEASILAIGAILSALSPNLITLTVFRFIQGIGIGGDYPVSATIMSEYANVKDRGKLIALVFANQGIGSVVAVFVGLASVSVLPPDMAWRVMLGVGAIPAFSVILLRRRLPETPRYSLLVKMKKDEAERAAKEVGAELKGVAVAKDRGLAGFLGKFWVSLIGTAGAWFLLDVAFYGTGIYSGPIIGQFFGSALTIQQVIVYAGIPFFIGLFGYFTAVALMDKLGRKVIQIQGFIMMAIIYVIVASVMATTGTKVTGFTIPTDLAFFLYAMSFFFIDFGPNTTTFVFPAEIYPVRYRTTGHGISAASGKLGAAISTLYFPFLLNSIGIKGILEMLAVLSILGAGVTLLLKEPKNSSLEEVSQEELEAAQEIGSQ